MNEKIWQVFLTKSSNELGLFYWNKYVAWAFKAIWSIQRHLDRFRLETEQEWRSMKRKLLRAKQNSEAINKIEKKLNKKNFILNSKSSTTFLLLEYSNSRKGKVLLNLIKKYFIDCNRFSILIRDQKASSSLFNIFITYFLAFYQIFQPKRQKFLDNEGKWLISS